jgi:hypothetical protein
MLAACGGADDAPSEDEPAPGVVQLSSTEHLRRASMALRGMKPSVEELRAVDDDPAALPAIVDAYLASPAFGKVVRDLHNEALLSRVDYFYYPAGFPALGPLADADLYHLNRSIQEASLRLIEHVVMNDRPYSEIVTADYYLANDVVAKVWGSLDVTGTDWQVTQWSDARPRAGILSDPWLFTRYQSTPSNKGRGRANAISKALICYDFLSRDIEIDASINLADPAVVDDAVVKNGACASCHQALDPLASYFADYFPLVVPQQFTTYPFAQNFPIEGTPGAFIDFYYPGLGDFYYTDRRDPSYFGQAADSVEGLGQRIAADPRFSLCAAKHFYAYLNQVDLADIEVEDIARLQETFVDSGMNARALARAVVLDPAFARSHSDDPETAADLVGVKKARTDQLGSMIEDLTGFRWELHPEVGIGQVDLLSDSFIGFQVLGGGIDSAFVTRPAHTFNATSSLVLESLAAEAAAWVVAQDATIADPAARRLFREVDPADAGEENVRAELAWLHARLFSELVDAESPEVDETWALYQALLAHGGDPARAWEGTLTAMLQDVRVATY